MPGPALDASIGVFGKLPARGDFVTRRFSAPALSVWDDWLQDAVATSRDALGEGWLKTYLSSPIWHFALAAGVCGPKALLGVVIPSVDSVGRYFPLMLGREIGGEIDLGRLLPALAPWYQATEALALDALAPGFELEAFDAPIPFDAEGVQRPKRKPEPLAAPGRHVRIAGAPAPDVIARLLEGGAPGKATLWWTTGSDEVAACAVLCPGLPAPEAFAAWLDGTWRARGFAPTDEAIEPSESEEARREPTEEREQDADGA